MPQNIFSQWLNYWTISNRKRKFDHNVQLNLQESRSHQLSVKSYPKRCFLEITNQCNLRCPMCGQSWFSYKRTFIPDAVLEKIRKLYPYMEEIMLCGFGESLVDKRFFDILAMIPPQVMTRFVSNGILLTPKVSEKMIELGLKDLSISIDAATPETYFWIRRQKGFERIIENIKTLIALKKERKAIYPDITMSYVIFKRNSEEFLDFIDLAHSLGVQRVSANYLIVYRPELIQESLYFNQELGNRIFKMARERAKNYGIDLFLPSSFEEAIREENSDRIPDCYEPWEFIKFRSDGKISPCCVNDVILGDLNTQSFEEIWNSTAYQNFRKMVNTTRVDPNCNQCMGWGRRKVLGKSNHIKLLDWEGNVIGPEPDPTVTNPPPMPECTCSFPSTKSSDI